VTAIPFGAFFSSIMELKLENEQLILQGNSNSKYSTTRKIFNVSLCPAIDPDLPFRPTQKSDRADPVIRVTSLVRIFTDVLTCATTMRNVIG
jgi:hypothetical protein